MRILYRTRQFWNALSATPAPEELAEAHRVLPPSQMALFLRMQASEQAHSIQVYRRLLEQGERNRDLLVAALLHDAGKSLFPMHPWARALVVLGKKLFPNRAKKWGQGQPNGLWQPFVVAEQHPAWGAEMATQAGASPLAVRLIQRHQEPLLEKPQSLEDELLQRLQFIDDES